MEKSNVVRIELPTGIDFTEEEKARIGSATRNEIVDIIKAKRLTFEIEPPVDQVI